MIVEVACETGCADSPSVKGLAEGVLRGSTDNAGSSADLVAWEAVGAGAVAGVVFAEGVDGLTLVVDSEVVPV